MSYYFVAQIRIHDPKTYQQYLDKVDEVFIKYRGKYLSVENNPVILEGGWNYTRCVLIQFESKEDFEIWYQSADYQEILKYRLASAECDSILIKGLS